MTARYFLPVRFAESSLSVVAVITSAGFGLTASVLTCGEGGGVSPGLADIGAPSAAGTGPDGAGIECSWRDPGRCR